MKLMTAILFGISFSSICFAGTLSQLMSSDSKVNELIVAIQKAGNITCYPDASVFSNGAYTTSCGPAGAESEGVLSLTYANGSVTHFSLDTKN